MGYVIIEALQ